MGSWRKSSMEVIHHHHHLFLYVLLFVVYFFSCTESLSRSDFPAGFIFGGASSAYQYEGAAFQHGKGPSIWDTFTREHPEKIADHTTGDIADDFYYVFKGDIALMKEIGLDFFRFSISWTRILPKGKISGGVNQEGITFYNNLINELLSQGLKPFITLFHWDVPQALEEEYGGFLSQNIVDDYRNYVDVCFKEFGDRVKYWVTINEPNSFTIGGYVTGIEAPGRCSNHIGNCTYGNSGIEPYIVGHNLLLSHATAVKLYKEKYQESQMGEIGISVQSYWDLPKYQTVASIKAAFRGLDFRFGCGEGWHSYWSTTADWLFVYPRGIRELMLYVKKKYNNPPIYITENGVDDNDSLPIQKALNDSLRIKYYHCHLSNLLKAIRAGVDVRGYFAWSFLDNFEWESGYTLRFGITYVDYKNGLTRYLKSSAFWFKNFLQKENVIRSKPLLYHDSN
ncbi:beta-glucosidase 13-like isoform X9 [Castanea sativa]|uniref:beta-glucosidase 13-like isoform X9 n=1 Tax=Castanea sativa TaxID=21020 RepID=UPI003F64B7CF